MKTDIAKNLKLAIDISENIENNINGIQIHNSDPANTAIQGAFYRLIFANHIAFTKLIKDHLTSSAACLLRPTFEYYIKNKWFAACANTTDTERFWNGTDIFVKYNKNGKKCNKSNDDIIGEIENKEGKKGLKEMKTRILQTCNKYLHGDIITIKTNINLETDEITHNYQDKTINDMLRLINNITHLTSEQLIATSINNSNFSNRLLEIKKDGPLPC